MEGVSRKAALQRLKLPPRAADLLAIWQVDHSILDGRSDGSIVEIALTVRSVVFAELDGLDIGYAEQEKSRDSFVGKHSEKRVEWDAVKLGRVLPEKLITMPASRIVMAV